MLDALVTALNATQLNFAHYGWSKAPSEEYGVYAEDGGEDLVADGHHSEQGLTGTVDYFTRNASVKATIESALEASGCAWSLNSVQFEPDTGYIHYEWTFGVV